MRTLVATFALLLAAPLAAGAVPVHRVTGDLAIRARLILTTYCGQCHGEKDAVGRLNVFDHRATLTHAQPAPFAAKDRALIVEFIKDGSMPLGNHPRPTAAEIATIEQWVAADAPEYPNRFGDAATAAAVLADWNGPLDKAARPYTRYASFAHLLTPAKSSADLDAALTLLSKAEAELHAAVKPAGMVNALIPVDAAATTFRFDIRDPEWHALGLFKPTTDMIGVYPMIPFDLIWLENPYSPAALPAGAADAVAGMNPHHPKPNPFRPQLFLRGDWLANQLRADGQPTPLAEELVALAELRRVLDDEPARKMIAGPTPRPFSVAKTDPPAPVTSWYVRDTESTGGPALSVEVTGPDGKPVAAKIPGGSDIGIAVTLNRAGVVRLAYVSSPEFDRGWNVTVDTPTTGGEPAANKKTVVAMNPNGKFTLTAYGTQHYLVYAAAEECKPVVVRSAHQTGKYPIFRAFPPDASVPVTRRVIPLTVVERE